MTRQEIELLAQNATLIETHSNWVLLEGDYAYKIKKPVRFSFLDYSTLERRRHFCERELLLNSRLSSGIYLDVLPVGLKNGHWTIGHPDPPMQDYALRMKRLDTSRQMNQLLEQGAVDPGQMRQIAVILANFHQQTEKVYHPVDPRQLLADYADILKVGSWLFEEVSTTAAGKIEQAVQVAGQFLERYAPHLQARNDRGLTVDGHGDLHTGNIFLLEKPVLFDCIEFNDHFRQLDVLDEVAFLYMDLESLGQVNLAEEFLKSYLSLMPCMETHADRLLFQYFLSYRANVRLKVAALRAMQHDYDLQALQPIHQYLALLDRYAGRLERGINL